MRMRKCSGLAAAAVLGCLTAPAEAAVTAPPALQQKIEASCAAGAALQVGGGQILLTLDGAAFSAGPAPVCAWVARAAVAVSGYFGRFPVSRVRLVIKPMDSDGVRGGTTYGDADEGSPLIMIRLGRRADAAQLVDDWTLTHELVHLAVPGVPENSHWLEEGIATYVEPIARVQAGELSAQRIWADMLHGMPKGLPAAGDRGLDQTPTWGRTYWGGALFCLLADVEIRRRSGNRKGLRDALRGVLAAGGSIRQDWPLERVLAVGDQATGVPVLGELYRRMGEAPGPGSEELDALWQSLGVQADGDSVRFAEDAPLAAVRRAITARGGSGG